jgi:putative ABC transport system substrate-binding protein
MSSRREICAAVCSLGMPRFGKAQASRARRVGALSLSSVDSEPTRIARRLHNEAMRRLGWESGRNLSYELRYADGDLRRLDAMAVDLARAEVDVILASLTPAVAAAQRATRTIPIVMGGVTFPIERGFVQSLARPGGNITGTAVQVGELYSKSFEIMRELAPDRSRLAVIDGPIGDAQQQQIVRELYRDEVARAAKGMGLSVDFYVPADQGDLPVVLARIAAARADLLAVGNSGVLDPHVREIAEFAVRHKILAMGAFTLFATLGGAMYYGSNLQEIVERAASFADRILRGAKPSDLPVELPTHFDLILNRKALQAIGIVPSPRVLLRANEVIE